MSTAKSIICFLFEHNLPKPTRDHCLTSLAKMRPNTATYWTTADFGWEMICRGGWVGKDVNSIKGTHIYLSGFAKTWLQKSLLYTV